MAKEGHCWLRSVQAPVGSNHPAKTMYPATGRTTPKHNVAPMTDYRKIPQRRRPLLLTESSNSSAAVIGQATLWNFEHVFGWVTNAARTIEALHRRPRSTRRPDPI